MITKLRRPWLMLLLVAVCQSVVLGWMVFDRNRLLAAGTEIVLPVLPVDPRSLFQGDYVRLGYAINQQPEQPPKDGDVPSDVRPVYVTLEQQPDGTWASVASASTKPDAVKPRQVIIQGTARYGQAQFGIETFFVPEGKGRELENLIGTRKLSALVAVDAHGKAGVKGLLVDGQPAYQEPWY
jgi:uncharacterized membrane-anchored protein